MNATSLLADRFEEHRTHLRAIAYRLLGSLPDAEDAVQQAWLRLTRSDVDEIESLRGWLTTTVSRLCVDIMRSRQAQGQAEWRLPDLIVSGPDGMSPEDEAILADSVGVALQVVLDRLKPAERLAFVLHDMFSVPFGDIARLTGRTPASVRQLASRARRRVAADAAPPDADLGRQRRAADAFFAATRAGDFDALLAILDPDAVLQTDAGAGRQQVSGRIRGAATIAEQALMFRAHRGQLHPVLVNGAVGGLVTVNGAPTTLIAFTVRDDRIVRLDILSDPARLAAASLPPV